MKASEQRSDMSSAGFGKSVLVAASRMDRGEDVEESHCNILERGGVSEVATLRKEKVVREHGREAFSVYHLQ